MRRACWVFAFGVVAALGIAWAQSSRPAGTHTVSSSREVVEHGEYIVHHVAMCTQCHTPRDERGELITSRLLQGARMPVGSPFPSKDWCFETPRVAGLPGWSDEEAVRFFMTGKDYRGYTPRAPMPPFRMTRQDAEAVVAYLRSVQ